MDLERTFAFWMRCLSVIKIRPDALQQQGRGRTVSRMK
jgi:hypothetical protein